MSDPHDSAEALDADKMNDAADERRLSA